jgi:hypothetical protein
MNVVVTFSGAQVKGTDLVKVPRVTVPRSVYSNFRQCVTIWYFHCYIALSSEIVVFHSMCSV